MSTYHSKLLELVSIEQNSTQPVLRIRLLVEREVELLWKIDHDTAENLKAVTVFGESHKYRLSFHSSWDTITNQHRSFLTRTYRDQSERIYFACSEAYANGLKAIKSSEQIDTITNLPFLSSHSPSIDQLESKVIHPNRPTWKLAWGAVALISFVSVMLLGFSGYSLTSKTVLSKNTSVQAESISEEVPVNHVELESLPSSEPGFPIIELQEVLTFGIPEGNVALTFDDGPSKYSKEITDILTRYKAGGTFFFIGNNVEKYPDYVKYVESNGYAIGSHSMNHTNFKKLSYEDQEYQLLYTNQLIEDIIQEKVVLFRPPYGSKNDTTMELMNNNQNRMVLWNTDTLDWKSRNPDKIFNAVLNSRVSGSIILLHESQAVVDALPRIIEYLQEQDLQLVNLR